MSAIKKLYPGAGITLSDSSITGDITIASPGVATNAAAITALQAQAVLNPSGDAQKNFVGDGSWEYPVPWKRYNAIRNPEMIVAQRGTSIAAIASTAYGLDGWRHAFNGTMVATVSQISASISADTSGNNWYPYTAYAQRVAFTTGQASLAAGNDYFIFQNVEGLLAEKLKSDPTSISLLVRSSITGTFTIGIQDSTSAYSCLNTVTITSANTWTRVTFPNIPAFGSGTFLDGTGNCYQFLIGLGAGTTFSTSTTGSWISGNFRGITGQTNFAATTGNTFDFTLVQHEPNPVCTPFVKRELAAEVALSQRYFQPFSGMQLGQAQTGSFSYGSGMLAFPAMRATPTLAAGSVFSTTSGNVGTAGLWGGGLGFTNIYNSAGNWTLGTTITFNGSLTAEL